MEKDDQHLKKFLEEQVQWCKEQDHILEEIERKLNEMKKIAQYASSYELNEIEVGQFNKQINDLKKEVHELEKQLRTTVH
ncbi:MAG TPA: hypothetical protein VNR38_00415 [Ureibacillus sp.]|nr:hypothetical protein [Ureibacillus sp.]